MSSGFVSAGTNEEPVERDDEWLKAQQELEEERRRKAEIGQQVDGKCLYEVLQQNKSELQSASVHEHHKNTKSDGDAADMLG